MKIVTVVSKYYFLVIYKLNMYSLKYYIDYLNKAISQIRKKNSMKKIVK